jgi:hypothetical protein
MIIKYIAYYKFKNKIIIIVITLLTLRFLFRKLSINKKTGGNFSFALKLRQIKLLIQLKAIIIFRLMIENVIFMISLSLFYMIFSLI